MKLILSPLFMLIATFLFQNKTIANELCEGFDKQILINDSCLKIKTFHSKNINEQPVMAVVLHGDSPFGNPTIQYKVAEMLSARAQNVITIGMLRPGYQDGDKRQSDGERGLTVGDNYDDERVRVIGAAIEALSQRHQASRVVVIGHSGGGAITGKLIGLFPDLIDHAVILSCPCDINAWREDMLIRNQYEPFRGNLPIASPIDLSSKVTKKTTVSLIIGENDDITKPYLSQKYYKALKKQGVEVDIQFVQGDHNIFTTKNSLDRMLSAIQE